MNMSHHNNGLIVLKPFFTALWFFLIDRPCCAQPKLRQMWTRTIAAPFIREQGSDTLRGHIGLKRMPGTSPESLTLLQTHLISRDAMQRRGRHLQRPALLPQKCRRLSRRFAECPQNGLWIEWNRPDCRPPNRSTPRMATASTSGQSPFGLSRKKRAPGLLDQIGRFFKGDKKRKGKVSLFFNSFPNIVMVNDNFLLNFLGKILVPDWVDELEYCLGLSGNCICIGFIGIQFTDMKKYSWVQRNCLLIVDCTANSSALQIGCLYSSFFELR